MRVTPANSNDHVELIRAYLADHVVGCPACKYNLHGCTGDVCPECGIPLEIHLSAAYGAVWPWMLAPLSVALPLGFCATLFVLGGIALWQSNHWRSEDGATMFVTGLMSVLYLLLLRRAIRRRNEMLRLPRGEQWTHALACSITMAAVHGIFTVILVSFAPW